jgi:hypothetical protein
MKKLINRASLQASAAITTGLLLSASPASAQGTSTNNFSNIAQNITTSISSMPALLSGLSYMFGIMLGVLGILKIKDHVENPQQTPLKDGAIRLAAGGGLFALPIVYEAMKNTVGTGNNVTVATLNAIDFTTN